MNLLKVSILLILTGFVTAEDIHFPPIITKQPLANSEVLMIQDKGFLLECEAIGRPIPTFRWLKNGENFEEQPPRVHLLPGKGTLVFSKSTDTDEGQYQCLATNDHGTAVSNTVKLRKVKFTHVPKDKRVSKVAINEGEPLTLKCESAQGYPEPKVFWFIQKGTEGKVHEINNSRLTVDPVGQLHFSNITDRDSSQNSVYACAAKIPELNDIKISDRVVLQVKTERQILLYKPVPQFLSPQTVVAVLGTNAKLHCIFGGTPLPEVKWRKVNGELPKDRYNYFNHGKSLQLESIELSDNGTYECTASNGITEPEIRRFQLVIHAAPYWISKPNNTNAADDDKIQFYCNAGGIPEPTIKWFVNGQELAEPMKGIPQRKRLTSPKSYILERLEKSDTAVYQCQATNPYGEIITNFFINVITSSPMMLQEPLKIYEAVEGGSITMSCRVFGAPNPNVYWMRSGAELKSSRFSTYENGDFKIHNVMPTDAGRYQCYARNKYGSVRSEATNGLLIVKQKTRITTKPTSHIIAAGESVTFYCFATCDRSLNLTINWLRDRKPISFTQDWHVIKSSNNSLSVIYADRSSSGSYTCVAETALDNTTATASLLVQDIPNAPEITDTDCTHALAKIQWRQRGFNYAPITGFKIEYTTNFAPDKWQYWNNDVISANDDSVTVTLTPWTEYTFRVVAFNKIGASRPSNSSKTCTTQPLTPYKNPDNVTGFGTKPNNLVISWMPMQLLEHSGPGFFYEVRYRLADSKTGWNPTMFIYDWRTSNITVENQPTYQRYYVSVTACNSLGPSKVPANEVVGYSGEDVPLQAPANFKLKRILNSEKAELSWDPVPVATVRGEFKGYRIQIWNPNPSENQELTLPANLRSVIVSNLTSFSRIYARIMVYNGAYNGTSSPVIYFNMPEGTPGAVESFDAAPLGKSAFYLKWTKPNRPNGILTGYVIYYTPLRGAKATRELKLPISDPKATRFKLSMLEPNTGYRISIRATTHVGEGSPSFIEMKTGNFESAPTQPSFTWYQLPVVNNKAVVEIVWIPDLFGNAGSSFFVQYRKAGRGDWIDTATHELHSDRVQLQDLELGVKYQVRVQSIDGEYRTASDVQEIETVRVEPTMSNWSKFSRLIDQYCTRSN